MLALPAIREVVVRLDGNRSRKQEAECTMRQAIARYLTDDDGCDSFRRPYRWPGEPAEQKQAADQYPAPGNRNSTDRRK
jgi:hypothetical protein